MHTGSQVVREFFDRYERSRNTFDLSLIDSQYSESFMFAGPDGARVAEKRAVLAGLTKGKELFKRSATHLRTFRRHWVSGTLAAGHLPTPAPMSRARCQTSLTG